MNHYSIHELRKSLLVICTCNTALFLLLIFLSLFTSSFGQENTLGPSKYPDLPYVKENTPNKEVTSYPSLREADVMWSKRVWRVIDLREKMNHPLYYPESPLLDRKNLYDVIIDAALKEGKITLFDNPATDDQFRYEMTSTEANNKLSPIVMMYVERLDGSGFDSVPTPQPIVSSQVWKYWIKEDWFYDKQRSVLDVRIIGICPLIEKVSESGEHLGADKPLFWIYFPEARPVFATSEVYMRKNDAERRTLDDIFWKRMFSSYIRKESNVYDRGIYDYKVGLEQQLESERVKSDIFTYEHDLWHF
ncbi:MAG: gliding motility protein GldN [Bacteroidetes bacterium]|nr:gliding motility protein GldN [Bacteroidota bacterium]